jgi:phosphinothricin acetyltransferase
MNFIIRQATAADGAEISRIYAHYVVHTAITFEEVAPDAAEMSRRIEETLLKYPWLIAAFDGNAIAYAYASQHRQRASYRWAVDVAIYVDQSQTGRGIGRSLYDVLLPLVRDQGFMTASAGITIPNAASVGLHESVGFNLVGIWRNVGYKLAAWRDVGWWQKPFATPSANPPEPTPWNQMPPFTPLERPFAR